MIPHVANSLEYVKRFSRTRGGDPVPAFNMLYFQFVFPALAGVILTGKVSTLRKVSFSRTRGGDPITAKKYEADYAFFPHSRG